MSLHELLGVLGLIVKLGCQLVVLQDGQSCLCLKLFIVEGHQISLRFLHLEVHLLRQLLHVLDLLELGLVDLDHAFALLLLVLDFQVRNLLQHAFFAILEFFVLDNEGLKNFNLLLVIVVHLLVLFLLHLMILVVVDFVVRISVQLLLSCRLQHFDGHLLLGVRVCVPCLCFFLLHVQVG